MLCIVVSAARSTPHSPHLLSVPAGRMGACPEVDGAPCAGGSTMFAASRVTGACSCPRCRNEDEEGQDADDHHVVAAFVVRVEHGEQAPVESQSQGIGLRGVQIAVAPPRSSLGSEVGSARQVSDEIAQF